MNYSTSMLGREAVRVCASIRGLDAQEKVKNGQCPVFPWPPSYYYLNELLDSLNHEVSAPLNKKVATGTGPPYNAKALLPATCDLRRRVDGILAEEHKEGNSALLGKR